MDCRHEDEGIAKAEQPKKCWVGELPSGTHPPPERYPVHICSWGAYVRFHGTGGKVRAALPTKQACRMAAAATLRAAMSRSQPLWSVALARTLFAGCAPANALNLEHYLQAALS